MKIGNFLLITYKAMKKIWLLAMCLAIFTLAGCNSTTNNPEINLEEQQNIEESNEVVVNDSEVENVLNPNDEEMNLQESKSLILVFSPTGNTKRIATFIQEINGSEMIELIPEVPYTSDDLNYNSDCRANREQNDDSARPGLASEVNLDWYDKIYLWYPIWWWTNPKLILTLIEKYDFSGKEVVLFCTSGSSWIWTSETALKWKGLNVIWSKRFEANDSDEIIESFINNN